MSQLKGMRVLELASVLAGPSVGQFFAELGAAVIKVENLRTGGDVTRSWKSAGEMTDDRSAYFSAVNWGKKSIAIDLSAPAGRDIAKALAKGSDIVISSFKPGDAEKLGVGYETLCQLNPKLIYGQVTGYGVQSPRVGYDAVIQAESGFMSMNGEPGGRSLKMPVALMDVLAAHHLREGLLLALLERSTTGKGQLVHVSLIQAAVSSLVNQAANWLVAKKLPQRQGSSHPNIAPYGDTFGTADGQEVLLAIGTDQQFSALCRILEVDLDTDPRFATNQSRVGNRGALNAALADRISAFQLEEFMKRIHDARVPAGRVSNVRDIFGLPEARELLLDGDGLQGVRSFAADPFKRSSHLQPPPHFGQHTRAVLEEFLNFSPQTVEDMIINRVIA